MRSRPACCIAGLVLLLIAASTACLLLWRRDAQVVEEDNIVESAQVAFLFLATIVHLHRQRRPHDADGRVIHDGLALFCLSLAVRELEIDLMGDPEVMGKVELVVRFVVVALWVRLIWLLLPSFDVWWKRRAALVRSSLTLMTLAGCVLYAASWPFDKFPLRFGRPQAMAVEETLQLNATLMLFVAAVMGSLPRTARGAELDDREDDSNNVRA